MCKPGTRFPSFSAAAEKLGNRVPGLHIDYDGLLQTPKHVASHLGFLSGPNGEGKAISPPRARAFARTDPHRAIKAFLDEHAALFGHDAEVLEHARVQRDFVARHNGMRTVV